MVLRLVGRGRSTAVRCNALTYPRSNASSPHPPLYAGGLGTETGAELARAVGGQPLAADIALGHQAGRPILVEPLEELAEPDVAVRFHMIGAGPQQINTLDVVRVGGGRQDNGGNDR